MTIEGDDGESVTVDAGVDGEIPDWFPAELPLPSEYAVVSTVEADEDDGTLRGVNLTTPAEFDALVESLDEALAASGITPELRQIGASGGTPTGMYMIPANSEVWNLSIVGYGEGEDIQMGYVIATEE
ncbi:MAG: hypothetical protein ACTH0V_09495 [Microbacteriaceae bacterium]|uniref:hypothetical protein n=1 Tax=Microbacterium sp. JB110 TaxID=2024477 RepID=UPI00097F6237|nr:hypothetical protein [Microbacterium sp. JB110]RCS63193.1 hypothetical protein CIK77_03155 [Microbacterium sp. JB110]SJM52490.1 hypothetical protein CZ774_05655 [Frigoribacterium sp. JB110]